MLLPSTREALERERIDAHARGEVQPVRAVRMEDRRLAPDCLAQHFPEAVNEAVERLHGQREGRIGPERFDEGLAGQAAGSVLRQCCEKRFVLSPGTDGEEL